MSWRAGGGPGDGSLRAYDRDGEVSAEVEGRYVGALLGAAVLYGDAIYAARRSGDRRLAARDRDREVVVEVDGGDAGTLGTCPSPRR